MHSICNGTWIESIKPETTMTPTKYDPQVFYKICAHHYPVVQVGTLSTPASSPTSNR